MADDPFIYTYGGARFYFRRPRQSGFTIMDIAHALSMITRFTGHIDVRRGFYSVAEHSIHVSKVVPQEFALEALLHDASEAFLGDVSRPLKRMLPEYMALEADVQLAICERFEVPTTMSPEVKAADMAVYETERRALVHPGSIPPPDEARLIPADIAIERWLPLRARQLFLERFFELDDARALSRTGEATHA